jgi:hypothetical protein
MTNTPTSSGVGAHTGAAARPARKASGAAAAKVKQKPSAKPASRTPAKTARKPASKAVAAAKPAKKAAAAKTEKHVKDKKVKLVRDAFAFPESEYKLIAAVKKRCLAKGLGVKKSEVLRAAIISFAAQSDAAVTKALKAVEILKTGRPPNAHK